MGVFCMTTLMQLRKEDKEKFLLELSYMDVDRLFAELDDTIQIDMMKMSTYDYMMLENDRVGVYRSIIKELKKRLERNEK